MRSTPRAAIAATGDGTTTQYRRETWGAASGGWGLFGCGGRLLRALIVKLERQLTIRSNHFVVTFVGPDDFLHQAVANHVAIVELDEADSLHAAQHIHHFDQ